MIEFSASEYARLFGIIGILIGYFIASFQFFISCLIDEISKYKEKKEDDKDEKK